MTSMDDRTTDSVSGRSGALGAESMEKDVEAMALAITRWLNPPWAACRDTLAASKVCIMHGYAPCYCRIAARQAISLSEASKRPQGAPTEIQK